MRYLRACDAAEKRHRQRCRVSVFLLPVCRGQDRRWRLYEGICERGYIEFCSLGFHKGFLSAADDLKAKIHRRQTASERDHADIVKELADLQKDKEKCEAERFANIDQFLAGNLDEAIYQKRRAALTKETERLDVKITELEAKLQETELVQDEETRAALETAERFYGAAEFDQRLWMR